MTNTANPDTIIGRRVLNRWQDSQRGVIVAVEPGCNGGVRVRFDGRDYDALMVPRDLAFEDLYPREGGNVADALATPERKANHVQHAPNPVGARTGR